MSKRVGLIAGPFFLLLIISELHGTHGKSLKLFCVFAKFTRILNHAKQQHTHRHLQKQRNRRDLQTERRRKPGNSLEHGRLCMQAQQLEPGNVLQRRDRKTEQINNTAHMTHTTTTNAVARQIGNMAFLDLFNSRSVFAVKGFDTIRKAKNYAKKCGYQLHDQLPEGVAEYQNPD